MDQNKTNSNECNVLLQYEILSKCDMRTVLTPRTKRLLGAPRNKKVHNITSRMATFFLGGGEEHTS